MSEKHPSMDMDVWWRFERRRTDGTAKNKHGGESI